MMAVRYEEWLTNVGALGPWQLWIYFWLFLTQFVDSMGSMTVIFMQFTPKFFCADSVDNSTDYTDLTEEWSDRAPKCSATNETIEPSCRSFKYDQSVMQSTIVTQWDLVCGKEFRIAHAQMVYQVGFFVGAFVSGYLSDRFGRRRLVAIGGLLTGALGLLMTYSDNFIAFLLARFFFSFANTASFQSAYILAMEVTTSKYRGWVGGLYYIPFAVGYTTLSLIAYLVRDWRTMHLIVSIPVCFEIFLLWILPESPRWLMTHQRFEDAKKTLDFAAKINRTTELTDKFLTKHEEHVRLDGSEQALDEDSSQQSDTRSIWSMMWQYRRLAVRCAAVCCVWFVSSLVYYAVSLNVTSFSGNIFWNNAIAGAIELPAYAFCVPLLYWGRKKSILLCLAIVGAALLTVPFIPKDLWVLSDAIKVRFVLAMVGKLFVTSAFAVVYVATAEIYPTVVRNSGLALGSSCARIGSMIAPYISLISELDENLRMVPMLVCGVAAFVGTAVTVILPETKDKDMPEHLDDMISLSSLGDSDLAIKVNVNSNDTKAQRLELIQSCSEEKIKLTV